MNITTVLTFVSAWSISAIALYFGYDYDVVPTVALSTGIATAVAIVTTMLSLREDANPREPDIRFLAWPVIDQDTPPGPILVPTAPFPEALDVAE